MITINININIHYCNCTVWVISQRTVVFPSQDPVYVRPTPPAMNNTKGNSISKNKNKNKTKERQKWEEGGKKNCVSIKHAN